MAKNARKLVTAGDVEVIGRSGKITQITVAVAGDRLYNLREVDVSGNVIYKVSAVALPHLDLNLGFRTALYAELVSGTTGEINVIYE